MPITNKEISQLNGGTPLTAIAAGDLIPVTDISDTSAAASGTTKPITKRNLTRLAQATKTGDYTTTDEDDVLFLDSATDKTLNLIAGASRGAGRPYYLKNINAGIWTVDGDSAETVDGAATVLLAERDTLRIFWTGTAWESI